MVARIIFLDIMRRDAFMFRPLIIHPHPALLGLLHHLYIVLDAPVQAVQVLLSHRILVVVRDLCVDIL
jgi:hypothetical protein